MFIRGSWVHSGAPSWLLGSFGCTLGVFEYIQYIEFIRVQSGGRWFIRGR